MTIQTLPAAPGDVIVVTVPQTLTQAERDALEARVVALVADTRVLVLDGGMQLAVLKRPDPDAGVLSLTVAGRVQENEIVRHVIGVKEPVVMRGKQYAPSEMVAVKAPVMPNADWATPADMALGVHRYATTLEGAGGA
jgi:hypothetical protein